MDKLLDHLIVKLSALALAVLVTVFTMAPVPTLADEQLGLDVGHRGRRVGDPLDTNDAGGDDDSGDDIHDTAGKTDSGLDAFSRIMRSTRVLLVPQYSAGILTFKLIFLSDAANVVEERYAK